MELILLESLQKAIDKALERNGSMAFKKVRRDASESTMSLTSGRLKLHEKNTGSNSGPERRHIVRSWFLGRDKQ